MTTALTPAAAWDNENNRDDEPLQPGPGLFWTLLHESPSWLTSLVFHLVLLVSLALLTIPEVRQDLTPIALFSAIDEEVEELVEFEYEVVDPSSSDIEASEYFEDPGMAETPELANILDETMPETAVSAEVTRPGSLLEGKDPLSGVQGYGRGSTEFFGVQAAGNDFVFIIDRSSSMEGDKFTWARAELLRAVRRLKTNQRFYVIFFDKGMMRMFGDEEGQPKLLQATTANVDRLARWVTRVETGSGTMPCDAVKLAMSLRPDAVYILSDGEFNKGDGTVVYLKDHNRIDDPASDRTHRITFHAIGFFSRQTETLRQIAQDYGGTYRFVDKPVERADKKK